eukprot:TRINITY_DN67906_c0_g1_i1.p1 TRINITY_DN67906_c0_g1~~TRINITY_DN67906_c0_g1_i1.p1  ORF type:complete len:810 (+),score=148.30 TRINITY_DN67906_c0_g1_i1:176-2605(+)
MRALQNPMTVAVPPRPTPRFAATLGSADDDHRRLVERAKHLFDGRCTTRSNETSPRLSGAAYSAVGGPTDFVAGTSFSRASCPRSPRVQRMSWPISPRQESWQPSPISSNRSGSPRPSSPVPLSASPGVQETRLRTLPTYSSTQVPLSSVSKESSISLSKFRTSQEGHFLGFRGEHQEDNQILEPEVFRSTRRCPSAADIHSELAAIERLQGEAVGILRERRVIEAALQDMGSQLDRQSRQISASQDRKFLLVGEEKQLEHEYAAAEHRMQDAISQDGMLSQIVEELNVSNVAAEFEERRLEGEVMDAQTMLQGVTAGHREIERQSCAAGEELKNWHGELRRAQDESHLTRTLARSEKSSLELAAADNRRELVKMEATFRDHASEAKARGIDLQRCRQAVAARREEIATLGNDFRASKALHQRAAAVESDLLQLEHEAAREPSPATSSAEARSHLASVLRTNHEQQERLHRERQIEVELESELHACEEIHVATGRRAEVAMQALAVLQMHHDIDLALRESKLDESEEVATEEQSELRHELVRVHAHVETTSKELHSAAHELSAAKMAVDRLRLKQETAEMRSFELSNDIVVQRHRVRVEEEVIEEKLEAGSVLETDVAAAATQHDKGIDELMCQCLELDAELDECLQRRAYFVDGHAGEEAAQVSREHDLHSSARELRASQDAQRADLHREATELEEQSGVLGQRRDAALERARHVEEVMRVVVAERVSADEAALTELKSTVSEANERREASEVRSNLLLREISELRAEIEELTQVETRLDSINASLQQQVCLMRKAGSVPLSSRASFS